MESQRSFLLIGLAMVGFLLWQQWQLDYGPQPVASTTTSTGQISTDIPSAEDVPVASVDGQTLVPMSTQGGKIISVTTDTLILSIDTKGGDVVSANLAKFPVEQNSAESYSILRSSGDTLHIAQSGLIGPDGTDSKGRPTYTTMQDSYELEGDTLTVPLELITPQGMQVTKNFVFTRGSHKIDVVYDIKNNTSNLKQVIPFGQLKQSMLGEEGSMFMPVYRGGAYSTEEDKYQKYAFDDMADNNLRETTQAGWAAMIEHYFVSAWVPPQTKRTSYLVLLNKIPML